MIKSKCISGEIELPELQAELLGSMRATVEFFGTDHDVNTLGVAWRIFQDFGAALGDHAGRVDVGCCVSLRSAAVFVPRACRCAAGWPFSHFNREPDRGQVH